MCNSARLKMLLFAMPGCYGGHKDIDAMYYIAVLVLVYHYHDLTYGLDPDFFKV